MQIPTGLFGGDPAWGTGTYSTISTNYRDCPSYRATVVTPDGMFQRAPVSCWYSMGSGKVKSLDVTRNEMRLTWSISNGLWNTIRIPSMLPMIP